MYVNFFLIEYIFEYNKETEIFASDIYIKAEIRRLISWFNDKFYREVTKLIIDERIIGYYLNQGEPDSEILRIAKFNLANHIKYINYLLARRKWLAGESFSVIDLIAAAHVSIIDYLGNISWNGNNIF